LLLAGLLAGWAVPAHAQAFGSIFGNVTDSWGAVLPGVTVTVTGTGLQQPLVATTTATGAYQFPSVPIGTYTVTFELASFKKVQRQNVQIDTGFNANIDAKLEVGALSEEVTVSTEAPVVDLKKTTTGATFTADVLEKIPTARDPWQIVNMTPGLQLSGYNLGGSLSGQQLPPSARGSSANVQWNLEGGMITDLSSNSSSMYYNFDSFDQIQVTTGGGDVSVQSSGLAINLVTKSGSNVFKGTFNATFENDKMQGQNVTEQLFDAGQNGFLSGNPLKKIDVTSIEAGGPIIKDRLWYWGAADHQDINVGITNFFDPGRGSFCNDLIAAQKNRQLGSLVTFDKLNDVQNCLSNDQTTITDYNAKINYQLNSANKFGYLFVSDNKIRNHRGASATTQPEATTRQFSDKHYRFASYPTHQIQHTLIASNKLVFNNTLTYLHGGFFLDYQDYNQCGASRYIPGADQITDYVTGERAAPDCLWNTQALSNRTTSVASRSLLASYQTDRPTWEIKTDGTYFVSNMLGGDHSLKFGLGWRKAPIMSFSHYSGGGRATVQCVGNALSGCGNGDFVAPGTPSGGLVPFSAVLYRDQLLNNDWWSYNGYLQDSYSRGRWRIQGGLRYDWQQSKYLGGCVAADQIAPDLLPAQCEDATQVDSLTGQKIKHFANWSPRLSVTYDLFGNGKTSVHASGSYYYDTKVTLANSLGGLATRTSLTWGNNQSSGACSTTTGASCWTDANHDGLIQRSELIGTPTASSSRFDITTGKLTPTGNNVDPNAKIGRTREAIVGVQHELIRNLAVGVDYIYRKYDRGLATYTLGYQPGAPGYPIAQIYSGPITYHDDVTGRDAQYYVIKDGLSRPTGVGTIAVTDPDYRLYHGVDLTATKRYSNRWQMQAAVTLQNSPRYFASPSSPNCPNANNPTGCDLANGRNTISKYDVKLNGSYSLKWDVTASANYNLVPGSYGHATSNSSTAQPVINGPGSVYGGINPATGATTTISYTTLEFQPRGIAQLGSVQLLDLGLQKSFKFGAGNRQVKLMFDAFNVMNVNTITRFTTNNQSLGASYSAPAEIVAPRVFRVGTRIVF
jgi:hypothetical protein